MIPGILLGALHIQLSLYNSKEVGYYYSQLVCEEKRSSEDHSISGRPAMSLSFFHFVFIIELITIWQTYIYAYIYLFPYTQIIYVDQKKLRITTLVKWSYLYNKVVSMIQHSLEFKQSLAFLRCLSIRTFLRYSKIGRLLLHI